MSFGCVMLIGDLLGLGMILGFEKLECGSFLELNWGGKEFLMLDSGEICMFIEDGDMFILMGVVKGDGY